MALRQSLSEFAATVLSIVSTRIELFALELTEQKSRLIMVLCLALGALLCLAVALLVLTFTLALYFWPTEHRYLALWVAVGGYAVAGAGMFWGVWRMLTRGIGPFEASLNELRNDIRCLTRQAHEDAPADPGGKHG